MRDLLGNASAWLEAQRTKYLARQVTYMRGINSVDVAATIGRTIFETDDDYGAMIRTESRDFLILTNDLMLAEQKVLPERGDVVRETNGDQIFSYEVLAPGNEPHFRFSDPYRQTLRIHTKFSGQEAQP